MLFPVSILALLAACVPQTDGPALSGTFASSRNPKSPRTVISTPTCTGGWGPYIGKELPDFTITWKDAFKETNLDAFDIKVEGVGEPWYSTCGDETTESWGIIYVEIEAAIYVEDARDPDLLGKTLAKIYPAVNTLILNEKDLAGARLAIRFFTRTDRSKFVAVRCNFQQGLILIQEGKHGKELYETKCTG